MTARGNNGTASGMDAEMDRLLTAFLRQAAGLELTAVGRQSALATAWSLCRELGLGGPAELARRLALDAAARHALLERVVVPETWLFRDPRAFADLGAYLGWWRQQPHPPIMRLLSVPCSSGEEPVSMAITLLEEGLAAERFRVDGVDISRALLDKARRGFYPAYAFRGREEAAHSRFFHPLDGGYQVAEPVRAALRHHHGNLLEATGNAWPNAPYDVIFCRNLMIYFDRAQQERALARLEALLAPTGLLVLAPAEGGMAGLHRWWRAEGMGSSAFLHPRAPAHLPWRGRAGSGITGLGRPLEGTAPPPGRAGDAPPTAVAAAGAAPAADRAGARTARPTAPPAARTPGTAVEKRRFLPPAAGRSGASPADGPPPPGEEEPLATARRLADQGRLREAERQLASLLERHGQQPQLHLLLGEVLLAQGREREAERALRRVLFLDPCQQEALFHLALLLEGWGRREEARRLRGRARRTEQRGGNGDGSGTA